MNSIAGERAAELLKAVEPLALTHSLSQGSAGSSQPRSLPDVRRYWKIREYPLGYGAEITQRSTGAELVEAKVIWEQVIVRSLPRAVKDGCRPISCFLFEDCAGPREGHKLGPAGCKARRTAPYRGQPALSCPWRVSRSDRVLVSQLFRPAW